MDILIYVIVIVFGLSIFKHQVKLRIWRHIIAIHIEFRYDSLALIMNNDAVGFLKLVNDREKKIREIAPWLRK